VLIFTKVGSDLGEGRKGLSARWITQAAEDSLRRLQTDVIDLYQSHWPDPETPLEETLSAYDATAAVREGARDRRFEPDTGAPTYKSTRIGNCNLNV
jgi:aryl-alcohol dehydrogenase-like predicted oxidoreductase